MGHQAGMSPWWVFCTYKFGAKQRSTRTSDEKVKGTPWGVSSHPPRALRGPRVSSRWGDPREPPRTTRKRGSPGVRKLTGFREDEGTPDSARRRHHRRPRNPKGIPWAPPSCDIWCTMISQACTCPKMPRRTANQRMPTATDKARCPWCRPNRKKSLVGGRISVECGCDIVEDEVPESLTERTRGRSKQ